MTSIRRVLAFVAAAAGIAAAGAGSGTTSQARALAIEIGTERDHISAPELAERIMNGDASLRVYDLRPAAEFEQMHIPTAQRTSLDALVREPLPRDATLVLYSEGGTHAAQAWVLMRLRGYSKVLVLREGMYEWVARVIEPRLAVDATPAEREAFARAAAQSRFFGGMPRADVPRSEVPDGYWTGDGGSSSSQERQVVASLRRRGC